MKNYILVFIAAILLFTTAFFIGRSTAPESGRYYFNDGKAFDTTTGEVYELNYDNNNKPFIYKYNRTTGKGNKIKIQ